MLILPNPVTWILKFHAVNILPAIIGAGAALIGGAMSDRSNRKAAETTNQVQEQLHRENIALQREFAQAGIRWKVEDAKAAGLHPLYALGASPATYSPSIPAMVTPDQSGFARGLAEAGQHVGRAIQAQQTPAQRQAEALSLQLLHAQVQKEFAISSYYRSEAQRNRQSAFWSAAIPEGTVEVGPLTKNVPDEVVAHAPGDPSKTAGIHPGWREYTFGKDREGPIRLILPVNEEGWSEGLSELPLAMYPMVYRANLEKYGENHALRVMRWIARGDNSGRWSAGGASGKW